MVTFTDRDKLIRLLEFVESEGYEIKRKVYRGTKISRTLVSLCKTASRWNERQMQKVWSLDGDSWANRDPGFFGRSGSKITGTRTES